MKIAILTALALTFAVAACGDDSPSLAGDAKPPDAVDAPPGGATLTTYVLDLIANHTTGTEPPRAFAEFSSLPDPDGDANNLTAFSALF